MKRKIFLLITIVLCGVISVLTEIFIFNFKTFTLDESKKNISDIAYTKENTEDKTTKLNLDIDNQYIQKLIIEYSTTEDVDYTISYTEKGAYSLDVKKSFDDIFDSSFSVAVTNINTTVSQLEIYYNTSSDLHIQKIIIDNAFYFNYFRAFFVFLALLAISSLFFFYKDGFCTEKIHIYFAVIGILLGLMIITAQPAMTFFCWDDQIHFDRVVSFFSSETSFNHGEYNISNAGVANSTWNKSTNSFTEHRARINYLNIEGDTDYTGNVSPSYLIINKLPYLPMAIGYHLSKAVDLPFIMCFQIGKVFNLLFYIILMSYAIKVISIGKRLLTVLALLPTNIFLASEYSYDPAVFAGITIFLVHIINLLISKPKTNQLNFKTTLVMIVSITYACLAKAIYAPLFLLTLLIPKNKFKNPNKSHLVKIGFCIITTLLLGTLLLPSLDGANVSDPRGGETSVSEQISLIKSYPLDYASIINDTAINEFNYRLFGSKTLINFSYAQKFSDQYNYYYLFIFLLIFAFLTDNKNNTLTKKQRLLFLAASLLVILLIWSALYIDFTPVGLSTINGVQNRYFLPLLLPILFSLQIPSIQNKIQPKHYNFAIFAVCIFTMIFMIYHSILVPYNF